MVKDFMPIVGRNSLLFKMLADLIEKVTHSVHDVMVTATVLIKVAEISLQLIPEGDDDFTLGSFCKVIRQGNMGLKEIKTYPTGNRRLSSKMQNQIGQHLGRGNSQQIGQGIIFLWFFHHIL